MRETQYVQIRIDEEFEGGTRNNGRKVRNRDDNVVLVYIMNSPYIVMIKPEF